MGMKTRAKRYTALVILCFVSVLARGQTGGDDPGQISGTVQATDGTKLPGVSISIKETEISTVTDELGNYLLTDVSLGQFTIMASLPGFAEKEVGGRGGNPRRPQLPDGEKILERLARETGGSMFEVTAEQSLEEIFQKIEEELRHQYSIGYTPSRDGSEKAFRRIELTTRKCLTVRCREGYYITR